MKYTVPKHIISVAHRGYSGKYKDNSLISFKKAFQKNFDMIEMDLQCSSDGEIFIFHDIYIEDKKVNLMTSNQLLKKNVLTLREFLYQIDLNNDKKILFDLKGDEYIAYKLAEFIKMFQLDLNKFYIASFNQKHLEIIRKKLPNAQLGFITENSYINENLKQIMKNMELLIVSWEMLDHKTVSWCRDNQKLIFTYTMKNKKILRHMLKYNVHGIISNWKLN